MEMTRTTPRGFVEENDKTQNEALKRLGLDKRKFYNTNLSSYIKRAKK